MRYEIKGETLPVVVCYLEDGEVMITERGSMSWMSPNMKMETTSNGGVGKGSWKDVRGRGDLPEPVYSHRRERDDRFRLQLPGADPCLGYQSGK